MTKHTPEQEAILAAAERSGGGLKVGALSGTGKTTTLVAIAWRLRGRGVYFAFNTAMKDEAEGKFPPHISCRTPHSAAYRAMNVAAKRSRLAPKLYPHKVAEQLGIPSSLEGLPGFIVGRMVIGTIEAFCKSTDREINARHAPPHLRIEPGMLVEYARRLWRDIVDDGGKAPFTHDHYLKMFHLSDKPLPGRPDYLLFDEAQDADPVMLAIAQRDNIPVFWVGDRHQQLYRWRGAVNAMATIKAPELPLTQSWRFGQSVANVANAVLAAKVDTPTHWLRGNPGKRTCLDLVRPDPKSRHVVLCRTNAGLFAEAAAARQPIHIVGGIDETATLMMAGFRLWAGEGPQRQVQALAPFRDWDELVSYVNTVDQHDLRFLTRMVDAYGRNIPTLLDDISARTAPSEGEAGLVLSSGHRAKGRQWPVVVLGDDFPPLQWQRQKDDPEGWDDEMNLLYVSATRAEELLVLNEPATLLVERAAAA